MKGERTKKNTKGFKWGLALALMLLVSIAMASFAIAAEYEVDTWDDLDDKIQNAISGDVIKITQDIHATSTISMPSGVTITLCSTKGGTYKLYRKEGSATFDGVLFQVSAGELILENITLDGDKQNGVLSANALIRIENDAGTLRMKDGATLQNNHRPLNYGGAIYIDHGIFIMEGGTITGNRANDGGGIEMVSFAKVEIRGGSIYGNEANNGATHGNDIDFYNGTLKITGGTVGSVAGNGITMNATSRAIDISGIASSARITIEARYGNNTHAAGDTIATSTNALDASILDCFSYRDYKFGFELADGGKSVKLVLKDYTLSFDGDGADASSVPAGAQTQNGSTVTVPNAPTRGNDAFLGWKLISESGYTHVQEGEIFQAGDTFLMPGFGLSLVAQWQKVLTPIGSDRTSDPTIHNPQVPGAGGVASICSDYMVIARKLNIREGMGTNTRVLGQYKRGTAVKVLEVSDGWAKIEYGAGTAYLSTQYLSPLTLNLGRYCVNASKLNVREACNLHAARLGYLYNGDFVEVLEILDGWARIEFGGRNAFVDIAYLK